jgi:hypothetical protein
LLITFRIVCKYSRFTRWFDSRAYLSLDATDEWPGSFQIETTSAPSSNKFDAERVA